MTDAEFGRAGSSSDFVRQTLELTRLPHDEVLTAAGVVGVYRAGFAFAQLEAGLEPLQAALFAMSYGDYVLGHYNELQSMLVIHEHPGQGRYEEEIPLPAARKASESATRYLRQNLNTSMMRANGPSLAMAFRDRYTREGVHPNPIDGVGKINNLLDSVFIFTPETTADTLAERLRGLELGSEPALLVHADRYAEFHDTQSDTFVAVFEQLLCDVESGAYLLKQEGLEQPTPTLFDK